MRCVRRRWLGVLAASLAATVVSGCGAFGGETRIEEALALVPADAGIVFFTDQSAAEERLGFEGLTSQSDQADIDAYEEAFIEESPWSATRLQRDLMEAEEWGWDALDVEWSVDTLGTQIYRMRDDLDMEVIADSFRERGYDESEEDGRLRFTPGADSDLAEMPIFVAVVLVPDDHLLLSGSEVDEVIELLSGEAESLADVDAVGDLLEDTEGVEFGSVMGPDASCEDILFRDQLPPEAGEVVKDAMGDLQPTEASVLWIGTGDDDVGVRVVSAYADEEVAQADEEARTDYLSSGQSLITAEPLADVLTVEATERNGDVVRFDLDFADGPQRAVAMTFNLDTPWNACPVE